MFRGSSSVHHQEFFTVHAAVVYVIQVCCVYSEKLLMMDRGTAPKHVEFHSKNKSEKLVHLVGFIIRKAFYVLHHEASEAELSSQ